MSTPLRERCTELLARLDLATGDDVRSVTALTGGVSSDIAVVDLGDRRIAVKFALEKLRVAADWHAPVNRNRAEYRWLEFAGQTVPGSAPQLYGRDAQLNGFAMELVQGDGVYLWKSALLERRATQGEARKAGHALGRIHAASTMPDFAPGGFQNQHDFYDLRLEPYLVFTATVYPEQALIFQSLVDDLQRNSSVLIHGDISPKNILFRDGQPVFLDAECATMGDPGFDVAFCINHLLLKSFHMPDRARDLLAELQGFWAGYREQITWESAAQLESRVCKLLPALMLARVDGKSPVEYLSIEERESVRRFSLSTLRNPPRNLFELEGRVSDTLKR